MKTAPPHNMTARVLKRRIHRFNALCVLHGSVLAGFAVLFWIVTVYVVTVSVMSIRSGKIVEIPWFDFDAVSGGGVVLILAFIVWIGFFHTELFFSIQVDPDLRAVRGVETLQLLSLSWWSFLLGAICFAPILTRLAAAAFGRRIPWNGGRNAGKIDLAVTVHQYLDDWGDWVPYPVFESQRQAVILLARLGMVRVSRRFGKHQVKLIGGTPKWKKKLTN